MRSEDDQAGHLVVLIQGGGSDGQDVPPLEEDEGIRAAVSLAEDAGGRIWTERQADGSDLIYSSFLGGSGSDVGVSVALDDLARYARLSAPHYAAMFRRITGYAPITFFLRLKMQKAAESLHTQLRVLRMRENR